MRILLALFLVSLALGHPVKEKVEASDTHIQKREVEIIGSPDEVDCSQLSGDALAVCNEKRVKRDAVMTDGSQSVNDTAQQNDNIQEAWSNEGAYARQGEGGQFISASDVGGPIVQILQHVYKANCCSCGCNCDCSGEPGPNNSPGADSTTVGP